MDAFVTRGKEEKPPCEYGAKCYRKNRHHLDNYSHPHVEEPVVKRAKEMPRTESQEKVHPVEKKVEEGPCEADDSHDSTSDSDEESDELVVPKMSGESDRLKFIRDAFLFPLPDDALHLWHLALRLNPQHPLDAFKDGGVTLCGPFDVLAGRCDNLSKVSRNAVLRHCRFYSDPMELQTLFYNSKLHFGYLRDDEDSSPIVCSGSNAGEGLGKLTLVADNLLAALEMAVGKEAGDDDAAGAVLDAVKAEVARLGISLAASIARAEKRKREWTAPSLTAAGIRVPVENDVGYRPLPESNGDLKKLLTAIDKCKDEDLQKAKMGKIDEIITYIQFANDECDYGMGLEMGVDLWVSGLPAFQSRAVQLLTVAYLLLQRPRHARILRFTSFPLSPSIHPPPGTSNSSPSPTSSTLYSLSRPPLSTTRLRLCH